MTHRFREGDLVDLSAEARAAYDDPSSLDALYPAEVVRHDTVFGRDGYLVQNPEATDITGWAFDDELEAWQS